MSFVDNLYIFFDKLHKFGFLLSLLLLIGGASLFSLLSMYILGKYQKNYSGVQKIHEGFVPRTGGLLVLFSALSIGFIQNNNFVLNSCFVVFPLVVIMLIEDIKHNLTVFFRLIASACLIFFGIIFLVKAGNFSYPSLNYPFLNFLTSNFYLSTLFYTIAILAMINGKNLIDGLNGNAAFSSIAIYLTIFQISNKYNLIEISEFSLILFFSTLVFLVFNFPFAKIFLGDSGAYFLGFIEAILVIALFNLTPLNPFGAILILIYPLFELIFSILRKFLSKNSSVFDPDRYHLHLQTFFLVDFFIKNKKFSNPISSIVIFFIAFYPLFVIKYFLLDNNPFYLIFIFIFLYIFLYILVRLLKHKVCN